MPTIYERGNKHRFRLYNPATQKTGWRTIQPWEYDGTKQDAKRAANVILGLDPQDRGTPKTTRFLPYALEVISKMDCEEKTRRNYITAVNEHMGSLHNVVVASIKYKHIRTLIAELKTKPKPAGVRGAGELYSANSIRNVRIPLNLILEEALRDDLLKANPVGLGNWPPIEETDIRILKIDEIPVLLQAALDFHRYGKAKYAAIVALALFAGLRKGEIIRLTWSDIDFEERVIYIRKEGIRRVKTKNAVRKVEMSELLRDMLWQHRLEMVSGNELDLVFATAKGTPIGDRNLGTIVTEILQRSVWNPKSTDPELQLKPTLHPLRHNYFSVLVAHKVDIKYVSSQGGHADAGFTLKRYTHVVEEKSAGTAAAAIDAHWGGTDLGPSGDGFGVESE